MKEIILAAADSVVKEHEDEHENYEYFKRVLVSEETAKQFTLGMLEIPPGKSAYPYHYHTMKEEVFYILSGRGVLKTHTGDREVKAGDYIFFPVGEAGAHKMTNNSDSEPLVYLDFGSANELEAAFYPDSGKAGIFAKNIKQLYKMSDAVDYYYGE